MRFQMNQYSRFLLNATKTSLKLFYLTLAESTKGQNLWNQVILSIRKTKKMKSKWKAYWESQAKRKVSQLPNKVYKEKLRPDFYGF